MNREIVENILAVIRTSTDKSFVLKGLLKLRTDLVKDQAGIELFQASGGVSLMVKFLTKPHEQILEIVLSILGNCCTVEQCCKEALDCKIAVALATILKSIPNTLIQCRACRLLGNLGKHDSNQLLSTHYPAMAQALCQIIDETSSVETRMMAFRACRFLLSNPQFLKYFLQANGFVLMLRFLAAIMKNENAPTTPIECSEDRLSLGLKRNQHREKYFEEVARNLEGVRSDIFDREILKNSIKASQAYAMPKEKAALDLACEILKCLLFMSELQMSFIVWESLRRSSVSFAPLVFFASEDNKHRSVALKILSNFAKNSGAFYILSSADAIVSACELLCNSNQLQKPLSESETRHCINIICMLSTDACNRSKIRRAGALRKLIAMMRESQSHSEIASILYLLNNFQYDSMSMDLMLKDGLIPVLINELNNYLSSDQEYHKKKREEKLQQNNKKRKIPEQECESICKFVKMRDEPAVLDCDSPSSSPRSYATPSSPCSSRSLSPVGLMKADDILSDNEADEAYSPVCSDDDDDEDNNEQNRNNSTLSGADNNPTNQENLHNQSSNTIENSEIMKLLDIACRTTDNIDDNMLDKEDDDDASQDIAPQKLNQIGPMPRSTIDIIENLLYRVTLLINKRGELGKPETMNTLIKAINVFGTNNNFAGALTNILLESQFFAQVIKQGVAHQLYQMTKVEEINKDGFGFLETLTCVGESNYGKAELARLLKCDDLSSQKHAAIAVAHIIRDHNLLYQFLNDGSALTVLLNIILSNKRDEYTDEAVDALTAMAKHTLGISLPQLDSINSKDYEEYSEQEAQPLHEACDMRFIVHTISDNTSSQQAVTDDTVMSEETITSVAFNKQLLCSTSEVFNTMLNSDFREGNEGEIHLRSYSVSGLRYFLNLIVRQSQNAMCNIPPMSKYQSLLEAFEMSRIYIIPSLEQTLLDLLILRLSSNNCLSVLEWALKNYHAELTEMAINYYLCSTLPTDDKVALFHKAEYSTYSTEWFQMIIEAVLMRCHNKY